MTWCCMNQRTALPADGRSRSYQQRRRTPRLKGVVRSLACACPSPLCPVRAARRAVTASELVRHQSSVVTPADQAPLFCKVTGEALSKKEVVEFYRDLVRIAGLDGVPHCRPFCQSDGSDAHGLGWASSLDHSGVRAVGVASYTGICARRHPW